MIKIEKFEKQDYALCASTVIINIDGETFPIELVSGGSIYFDENYSEHLEYGPWIIQDIPEKFQHLEKEITDIINEKIPWGCCGGCV